MLKNKMQINSSSVRGGYRENAGRKSSWHHSNTCTIRIPKPFAEQLIELARRLDNGEIIDTDTESKFRDDDLVTESIQVGADPLDSPIAQTDKGASIDIDTKSNLANYDLVTKSKPARIQDTSVTDQLDNLSHIDTVTKSILLHFDTVTNSSFSSSGSLTPLGCQPETEGVSDNVTESFSSEFDNATKSNLLSKNQNLTQSIPDIKEALAQALTIVKAKKSAKESMARLLSKLYSTQVSPDDLK